MLDRERTLLIAIRDTNFIGLLQTIREEPTITRFRFVADVSLLLTQSGAYLPHVIITRSGVGSLV